MLAESLAAENSSLTDNYNQQVGLWVIVCHFLEYSTLKLLQFLIFYLFCYLLIFMFNQIAIIIIIEYILKFLEHNAFIH